MEWWFIVIFLFIGLLLAFFGSIPIAISFLLVDLLSMYFVMGDNFGTVLIGNIYDSLAAMSLTPIPLFILMGEFLFKSQIALKALDAIEKWLGRLPGRLSILSVVTGALFASLSGSSIANTGLLGSVMAPQMKQKKYHKSMIIGPIVASGSLAMMIPPSSLTVVFGSLSGISVGDLLVAGLLPGMLLAGLYIIYIIVRCWLNPDLAPGYEIEKSSFKEILFNTFKHVLPLALIVIITIGVIFFGVATPTEAAAFGAMSSFLLAWITKNLNWRIIKKSIQDTVNISAMILIIIAGSSAFSHVLSFSGASRQLLQLITDLPLSTFWILICMLAIVFILGMFIEEISIMMMTIPIFMPIVTNLNIDEVWFGILMLMVLEISLLTPPVGMLLFTFKGIAPKNITMTDIWKSSIPYVICGIIAVIIILNFKPIVNVLI